MSQDGDRRDDKHRLESALDIEAPEPTGGLDVGLKEREAGWQLLASAAIDLGIDP